MTTELRHGEIPAYDEYLSWIDQLEVIRLKMLAWRVQEADVRRAVGDIEGAERLELEAATEIADTYATIDVQRTWAGIRHAKGLWASTAPKGASWQQ